MFLRSAIKKNCSFSDFSQKKNVPTRVAVALLLIIMTLIAATV